MRNRWLSDPRIKRDLLRDLKAFYEDAEDLYTPIEDGLVDIRSEERKKTSIPATRLFDGTADGRN